MQRSSDLRLAEIAAKALKETRYHLRYSAGWVVRLGDGTEESHARTQAALDSLWRFTRELFEADDVDAAMASDGIAPNLADLAPGWLAQVDEVLREATLKPPGRRSIFLARQARPAHRTPELSPGGNAVSASSPPRSHVVNERPTQVWDVLKCVWDPEIPVLSIVDLGIVRHVRWKDDGALHVGLTPTYSGCPATEVIRGLRLAGARRRQAIGNVIIDDVLSPPWSSDWLSEEGRRKLLTFGIAPPAEAVGSPKRLFGGDACFVSALRERGNGNHQRVRLDSLQGPLSLHGLPRAVRSVQVHLEQ